MVAPCYSTTPASGRPGEGEPQRSGANEQLKALHESNYIGQGVVFQGCLRNNKKAVVVASKMACVVLEIRESQLTDSLDYIIYLLVYSLV
jgi:hypothetical protein